MRTWLTAVNDANLLAKSPNWGWRERGAMQPSHITYVLRHATFHLGLLCAILDGRGIRYGVFK